MHLFRLYDTRRGIHVRIAAAVGMNAFFEKCSRGGRNTSYSGRAAGRETSGQASFKFTGKIEEKSRKYLKTERGQVFAFAHFTR